MCVCVGVCILQWQMPAGPGQMMETIANCSIRQSNLANLIFSFVCHPLPPSAPPTNTFPDLSAQQLLDRTKIQKEEGEQEGIHIIKKCIIQFISLESLVSLTWLVLILQQSSAKVLQNDKPNKRVCMAVLKDRHQAVAQAMERVIY